jgi:Transmembrane family 220, helix
MMTRALHVLFAALFAFSALLQLNDPDPLQWIAVYLAAAAVSALAAFAPARLPRWLPWAVAAVAFTWGAWLTRGWWGQVAPSRMFEAWEMKNAAVELERESFGLFIVAAWMLVVAWTSRRPARATR